MGRAYGWVVPLGMCPGPPFQEVKVSFETGQGAKLGNQNSLKEQSGQVCMYVVFLF